jgi:hypothetical protein
MLRGISPEAFADQLRQTSGVIYLLYGIRGVERVRPALVGRVVTEGEVRDAASPSGDQSKGLEVT